MKKLTGFNYPADKFRHGIDEPHVFDIFLEDKKFLPILDAMKAPAFPWRMTKILNDTEDNYLTNIQMAHMFYDHCKLLRRMTYRSIALWNAASHFTF